MLDTTSPHLAPARSAVQTLTAIDWIALILMIVGGINWGLVGAANFDLVAAIFGTMTTISRIAYVLVGIAAVWGIVMAIRLGSRKV